MPSGTATIEKARRSRFLFVVVSAMDISICMTAYSPMQPLRTSSQSMEPMDFRALPRMSATPANTTSASIRLAMPLKSLSSLESDNSSSAFLIMLNMKYRAEPAMMIRFAGI